MNLSKPRVFIYNEHWLTYGGGESYLLQLARSLEALGFQFYLCGVNFPSTFRQRIFRTYKIELDQNCLLSDWEEEIQPEDIFINGSFGSKLVSPVRHGIYVCHFPVGGKNHLLNWSKELKLSSFAISNRLHFFDQDGVIRLYSKSFVSLKQSAKLHNNARSSLQIADKSQEFNLHSGECIDLESGIYFLDSINVDVKISQIDQLKFSITLAEIREHLKTSYLISYQDIWCNSNFTRSYIEKYWKRNANVVYPYSFYRLEKPVDKNQEIIRILNISRFMSPLSSHPKKQVTLIRAFKKLQKRIDKRLELHLVGNVSGKKLDILFLKILFLITRNSPNIYIHVNASNSRINKLMNNSNIYWHATGLSSRNPLKYEHFGIAILEAISCGLTAFAPNKGGAKEILSEDKRYLFETKSQLIELTKNHILANTSRSQQEEYALQFGEQVQKESIKRLLF